MSWIAYYTVLLVLFLTTTAYSATHPNGLPFYMKALSGAVPILSALAQALARVNFKLYLWTQRLWLYFHRDATALWRFGMRFDGVGAAEPLTLIEELLRSNLAQWNPKILTRTATELRVIVDRTIHLTFRYESASFAEDGQDHLTVRSDELEVTFGSAKRKIDTCVAPLMSRLSQQVRAENTSTMFEVSFAKDNPFFTFFVAHLRPEQVTNFNLVFRPSLLSRGQSDKVVVTQQRITINAETPEGFSTLAKAFLLLTEDAATLRTV